MSRTDLDSASLAKSLRRMAGDGSIEWVLEPMQASVLLDIADALEAVTCELEGMHGYTDPFVRTRYAVELSCHTIDEWGEREPPEYCPYCGRRVVSE